MTREFPRPGKNPPAEYKPGTNRVKVQKHKYLPQWKVMRLVGSTWFRYGKLHDTQEQAMTVARAIAEIDRSRTDADRKSS